MIKEPTSPKSMKNSIWDRPDIKSKKKNWQHRASHEKNRLVSIGLVSQKKGEFFLQSVSYPTFDEVKLAAQKKGFGQIRMGAIKVTLS
jgi:hypothetical protein